MTKCPICKTQTQQRHPQFLYYMCPECDLWFQSSKTIFGGNGDPSMGEAERKVNSNLAKNLFTKYLKTPSRVMDIGSCYPYLSHAFQQLGCSAHGIDDSPTAPENYKNLNVSLLPKSFEDLTDEDIKLLTKDGRFKLISMIHMFERTHNPIATVQNCRKLLADDGILFIRMLDHTTDGFNEVVSPSHYTSHPFFHSLPSILEVLVQTKDQFCVAWNEILDGAGQRDLVLKPLSKKPMIWTGMIVKNEERDLPRCLNSIKDVVDGLVLVDTGSLDKTIEVVKSLWTKPLEIHTYTEASKQDETGDWKLWDFSKARNIYVDLINQIPEADYMLWMDADDELLTPTNLQRSVYLTEYEIFGINIETGGMKWVHHRMWKTRCGIKYNGRIHEYPDFGGKHGITLMDCIIRHDAAPGIGENSNQRNLRILEAEFAEEPTSRCTFYLANTHKDAGRWVEAVKYYKIRISMGEYYRDEWLFAYLYRARCERAAGLLKEAENTLLEALSKAPNWSEFWMELAYMAFDAEEWEKASGYCMEAHARTSGYTQLWREPNMYADQPLRLLSFCAENQGDRVAALSWALKAKEEIGVNDTEWNQRVTTLQGKPQLAKVASQSDIVANFLKKTTKRVKRIALHRPGAIGDIIMTLNVCELLQAKYPGYEIHYFCHPGIGKGLEPLFKAAGITAWHDFKTIGPDYEQIFNLIGYPLNDGYPEKPMKKHLLHYFAAECGLIEQDELPQLKLPVPDLGENRVRVPENYATLQVKAGWSMYKSMEPEKWEKIIAQCPNIPFIQIGGEADPRIPGANHSFLGQPLMGSVELLANAKMHLGIDSFPNHLTHILWERPDGSTYKVPGVILWGSTQWDATGYKHNTNISLGLPCQPCFFEDPRISNQARGPCINPPEQTYENPRHACMAGISVKRVVEEVQKMWSLQS